MRFQGALQAGKYHLQGAGVVVRAQVCGKHRYKSEIKLPEVSAKHL